jgi:ApbE superfamily uncharacterized protein (UPF0280 family)
MYEPRHYRHWIKDKDLVSFTVQIKETDLQIRAKRNLTGKAQKSVARHRSCLEKYIEGHPAFLSALEPIALEPDAPDIVKSMAEATAVVGVGPMAAVAGAIAERVGEDLLDFSSEVIIENGGDIFLKSLRKRVIGIYAGESPFTGKLALEVDPDETPLGICSSSGTVGHSLSFGRADAVVVLSSSTSLADAAATGIGNMVSDDTDIPQAIEFAQSVEGLRGVMVIVGDKLGLWGEVKLSPLEISSEHGVQ